MELLNTVLCSFSSVQEISCYGSKSKPEISPQSKGLGGERGSQT